MKIKISTTGSQNVTITGKGGFNALAMSGNYCPDYKDADCSTAGIIKFTMDSSGGVSE